MKKKERVNETSLILRAHPVCPIKKCHELIDLDTVTSVGVSFKCPVHGRSGLRHDSMTVEDQACLFELPKLED